MQLPLYLPVVAATVVLGILLVLQTMPARAPFAPSFAAMDRTGGNESIFGSNDCLPESLLHCMDDGKGAITKLPELPSTFTAQAPPSSAEEGNGSYHRLVLLSGRIGSMLVPLPSRSNMTMASPVDGPDGSTAVMAGSNGTARMQAMKFSMAQNVAWVLAGNWSLTADNNNTVSFHSAFTKVTVNGDMLHHHTISNFKASSGYEFAAERNDNKITIPGTGDIYFNNDLAWRQARMNLTLLNDNVLRIDINSADVDNHFHGEPIYGVVASSSLPSKLGIAMALQK